VTGCTALTYIICYVNKLDGADMEMFVTSLPTVTNGMLQVKFNDNNEGNSMTAAQVATARAKGWLPKHYISSWVDYDGEDATAVERIRARKTTEGSGAVYDLLGRRVENQSKSGLYIQNGRKVMVK